MKSPFILPVSVAILMGTILILQPSCKKKDAAEPDYLTVDLPNSTLQNDLYYSVNEHVRYIEMEFSESIDSTTVQGNISFSDKGSSLDNSVSLESLNRMVVLKFDTSFHLKNGWQYHITIGTGLRSVTGKTFASQKIIDVRTPSFSLSDDITTRNAILCISDIHMGEQRATLNKYSWFNKNDSALTHLLDYVLTSSQVKQVVILGDLFDEWVIPYRFPPFDPGLGVTDSRGYFLSVANSPVNIPVLTKLKAIALRSDIQLIYVPGNHDMLLTQSVLQEIIPGIIWKGTANGMGEDFPVDEIVMEHGHRFDLFNCPQPLVNPGHMLPPGFFVSRLQAECSRTHMGTMMKEASDAKTSYFFSPAWRVALDYLELTYNLPVNEDSVNIQMSGIDGYTSLFSYNSAKAMYEANIEDNWANTQRYTGVPVSLNVLEGILDGQIDLYSTVCHEYFSAVAPVKYKMAVLGHTHNPEIKVYPAGKNYTAIYANSGSWVNEELSTKKVRTFLLIWPGQWSGSPLDIVSLYQYNLDSGSGLPDPGYIPVLLAEESILRGN
ncbi:MAG: metallophosphoesterase [Bacteroidetes bacterium]|nr:metallophosphoesterase [Bacteroidota bacterium]